jgi:hypothetical protein
MHSYLVFNLPTTFSKKQLHARTSYQYAIRDMHSPRYIQASKPDHEKLQAWHRLLTAARAEEWKSAILALREFKEAERTDASRILAIGETELTLSESIVFQRVICELVEVRHEILLRLEQEQQRAH